MTAAAPPLVPDSRVLASWWRSLASYRPQALGLGSLAVHHVEALVSIAQSTPLDRFRQLVLETLAQPPYRTGQGLDALLHLGPQLLQQILRGLMRRQLADSGPNGVWTLTAAGATALRDGQYRTSTPERRSFHFLDASESAAADRPPRFLNLAHFSCTPTAPPAGWHFDLAALQSCLAQPESGKRRLGFPLEVQELLLPEAAVAVKDHADDLSFLQWQRIVVDRPERLQAAFIRTLTDGGDENLLGFEVNPGTGGMGKDPVVVLDADWRTILPELAEEPTLDLWRQGWRDWCEQHGLPGSAADRCALERQGYSLRVNAPPPLLESLGAALGGETWLLAGSEQHRVAVLLELHPARELPATSQAG